MMTMKRSTVLSPLLIPLPRGDRCHVAVGESVDVIAEHRYRYPGQREQQHGHVRNERGHAAGYYARRHDRWHDQRHHEWHHQRHEQRLYEVMGAR